MRKKILIADDQEEILKMLEQSLRQNNYSVVAVSRGRDALRMANLDKPDLVLLDIAMPDMDGYAIASDLRNNKSLKDVPIIFLTGKELESAGIEKRIQDLGAYDYITKPCDLQDLLAKIKKSIG
ncbi:MAG: response regulator [Candidatus Omnitrophota bacterium]|jgi:DNA-binding response OmpR family regulator